MILTVHVPVVSGVKEPRSGTVKNSRSPTAYKVFVALKGFKTAVNFKVEAVLMVVGVA